MKNRLSAMDQNDLGSIPSLPATLRMKDDMSAQTYTFISWPFFSEVKESMQELLVGGLSNQSQLLFALVACVRKRDVGRDWLRLPSDLRWVKRYRK